MSKAVVVDTNVVSYLFKRDTRGQVYAPHLSGLFLLVSFQTVAELWFWADSKGWGPSQRTRLNEFLEQFSVCPSSDSLARRWARVMTEGRQKRRPLLTADAWVAATALELELPLVTHNPEDFTVLDHLEVVTEVKKGRLPDSDKLS